MNLDDFGVEVSNGESLSTLQKGQGYFSNLGINIVRYSFTTDSNKIRSLHSFSKKALKTCVICENKLYHSSFEGEDHRIRQKKMLTFVDNNGRKFHTCYKLNSCLSRVGFQPKRNWRPKFKMPTFLEFIGLPEEDIGTSAKTEDIIRSAELSFNSRVAPFISKWVHKPIDKSSVSEFLNEFEGLHPHFIYYDEEEIPEVKKKLLNIIGVTV